MYLFNKIIDRHQRSIRNCIGSSAPELVEGNHFSLGAEFVQRVQVVTRGARPTVQQQYRGLCALPCNAVPDLAALNIKVSFFVVQCFLFAAAYREAQQNRYNDQRRMLHIFTFMMRCPRDLENGNAAKINQGVVFVVALAPSFVLTNEANSCQLFCLMISANGNTSLLLPP